MIRPKSSCRVTRGWRRSMLYSFGALGVGFFVVTALLLFA